MTNRSSKNDFGPSALLLAGGIALAGMLVMAGIGHHKAHGAEQQYRLGLGVLTPDASKIIADMTYAPDGKLALFGTLGECQAAKDDAETQDAIAKVTAKIMFDLGPGVHVVTACLPYEPPGTST
jgi:hypothetical protein